MTTTSLVPTNATTIDTDAENAATRSKFTPYVVLLSGMHKAVQDNEPPGSRPGCYLFAKRKLYTPEQGFLAIIPKIQFRPRASFNPPAGSKLPKIETRDVNSPEWAQVAAYKESKKQEIKDCRPKIGVEALLWLPEENEFAIMSLQNSARKATPQMSAARSKGVAVRIRSKKESFQQGNGTVTYFVPVVEELILDSLPKLPSQERVNEVVTQFLAYQSVEEAAEEAEER